MAIFYIVMALFFVNTKSHKIIYIILEFFIFNKTEKLFKI